MASLGMRPHNVGCAERGRGHSVDRGSGSPAVGTGNGTVESLAEAYSRLAPSVKRAVPGLSLERRVRSVATAKRPGLRPGLRPSLSPRR